MSPAFRRCFYGLAMAWMVVVALSSVGCQKAKVDRRPDPVAPIAAFSGPRFLLGTVGSLTVPRGTEDLIVSGYGIVVNLPGTGSSEVPPQLRQRLLTELRQREIAGASAILADKRTAVVAVQGLVPAGSLRGQTFDVLVSALPGTQTTSLMGGDLWEVALGVGGTAEPSTFVKTRAAARGPLYTNPTSDNAMTVDRDTFLRQGVVLGGGRVVEERRIELALREPSWTRSRLIADRINMRFPHEKATDVFNTAMPETDEIIKLNIPERFRHRRMDFLSLVQHTYVQGGLDFEPTKAVELGKELERSPEFAGSIEQAWFTLGRTALPVIREYYNSDKMYIQLTALAAGAKLEDGRTLDWLRAMAKSKDVNLRRRAAELLVELPRGLLAVSTLHELLDDTDKTVRIAAYEALAKVNDPIIGRVFITDGRNLKFILDLVPSSRSLIYTTHSLAPRIVIFNPMTGFRGNMVGTLMQNRLMVRSAGDHEYATVFYQFPGRLTGEQIDVAPTVANIVRLMGHKSTSRNPDQGLNLSYGEIVGALYQLKQQGFIECDVEIRINGLARVIANAQTVATARPEVAESQPELSDDEYVPPVTDSSTTDGLISVEEGMPLTDDGDAYDPSLLDGDLDFSQDMLEPDMVPGPRDEDDDEGEVEPAAPKGDNDRLDAVDAVDAGGDLDFSGSVMQ